MMPHQSHEFEGRCEIGSPAATEAIGSLLISELKGHVALRYKSCVRPACNRLVAVDVGCQSSKHAVGVRCLLEAEFLKERGFDLVHLS